MAFKKIGFKAIVTFSRTSDVDQIHFVRVGSDVFMQVFDGTGYSKHETTDDEDPDEDCIAGNCNHLLIQVYMKDEDKDALIKALQSV